jgi:hypothetical protein
LETATANEAAAVIVTIADQTDNVLFDEVLFDHAFPHKYKFS